MQSPTLNPSPDISAFIGHGTGVDALSGATSHRAGRRDGRSAGEMRAMTITHGVLPAADGSARIKCGATDVLVGVYGPMDCPIPRQRADDVQVHVAFRKRDVGEMGEGVTSAAEMIAARDLRNVILEVILGSMHPRKALVVAVQVLADHGGMIATAVNASILALLDAGVPMGAVPSAACASIKNGAVIVDPVRVEEMEAEAVLTITFDTALATDKGFMSLYTQGDCGGEQIFAAAIETCRQLAVRTKAFHKLSLERRASHPYVWNTSSIPSLS